MKKILILILLITLSLSTFGCHAPELTETDYQAVFLNNGQVYFGKITENTDDWITLEDIYYLQLAKPLQSQEDTETAQQPDLTLIKLGNELHAPTDKMHIVVDNVQFVENLSEESKVLQAIQEYKKDKGE